MRVRQSKPVSTLNKIMSIYIAVLTAALLVLSLMDRFLGYALIQTDLVLSGCMLLLWSFILWGVIALVKKIKSRYAKIGVGMLAAFVMFLIGTLAMVLVTYLSAMWLPSKYSIITSESGKSVVVMKVMDTGIYDEDKGVSAEQRMLARRDDILSRPDAEIPEEGMLPTGAYGYVYYACPRVMGIFFNSNVRGDGVIYRGVESESTMRYEWRDDGSLRLYLENPEVGDSGEIILN